MEVLCRVWKDEDECEARRAYAQCLSMPASWVHEGRELSERAAEIKAHHRVSGADAWIAAAAVLAKAQLVHEDPAFRSLDLMQLTLPHKAGDNR
jgi:predicted nucleic acid-binding protein